MEPKFSLSPEASDAAMPSACRVVSASRRRTLAAVAAHPSVPMDEVACHPRV